MGDIMYSVGCITGVHFKITIFSPIIFNWKYILLKQAYAVMEGQDIAATIKKCMENVKISEMVF